MRPAGMMLKQIMDELNETDRSLYGQKILRAVSRAVEEVVAEHFFHDTVAEFSPSDTLTASTAQPFYLPSKLRRIKSVRDASYTYYEDTTNGHAPKHPYNWYYGPSLTTPLQSGLACTATPGDATVIIDGDVLGASIVGEYMQIGQSPDKYLISTRTDDTNLELSEKFRAEEEARNAPWEIRPCGTRSMYLCDEAGTLVSPTTLTIEYQFTPLTVYKETDVIQLSEEACNAVMYKALQISMRRKGWGAAASNLEIDFRHALALAKRSEPQRKESMTPKSFFRRPRNTDILRNLIS